MVMLSITLICSTIGLALPPNAGAAPEAKKALTDGLRKMTNAKLDGKVAGIPVEMLQRVARVTCFMFGEFCIPGACVGSTCDPEGTGLACGPCGEPLYPVCYPYGSGACNPGDCQTCCLDCAGNCAPDMSYC